MFNNPRKKLGIDRTIFYYNYIIIIMLGNVFIRGVYILRIEKNEGG
jgi:hypothetical protein